MEVKYVYRKPEFTSPTESEVKKLDNGSYCIGLPVVIIGVVIVSAVSGK